MNKEPSIAGGLSSALDASRWIAALMVVLSHVHQLVLVSFPLVERPTYIDKALYFFGGFGSEAVIIFFVISGYLVGGTTSKRWIDGQRDMWRYISQRVSRIYTVLIPALVIGGALDILGLARYGSSGLYGPELPINATATIDISPMTFVGNILMLDGIHVQQFGTNGPIWSLVYEWWYYCVFAAGLGFFFYAGVRRWLAALLFIAAIGFLPLRIWLWMSIWGLGVLAFHLEKSVLRKPPAWLGTIILIAALIISRLNHGHFGSDGEPVWRHLIRDGFLGLSFAFALICWSTMNRPLRNAALHNYMAGFSYSLYLIHFPVIVFTQSVLKNDFGIAYLRQPSVNSYCYVVLLLAFVYLFAWAFSRFTEENTGKVFRAIYRIGKGRGGEQVAPT